MKSKNLICILLCIIVALLPVAAQAEGGSSGQAAAWVGDWAVIPKDGGFSSPRSIAIDGNDNIYVLDANLRLVYKLGAGSSNWTNFALDPGFTETSDAPWAITAHNLDMYYRVYLLNSIQDTARVVWRYDSAQNKWTDITYGQLFRQPEDIATSSDGTVYVTDSYNNGQYIEGHVLKLAAGSTNWTLIGNWNNGQFEYVPGIAVDSFGTVYVTDYSVGTGSSGRISKLTKAQSTWQLDEHLGSRLKKPLGIIRDNLANLYVADAETKQIHAIPNVTNSTWWYLRNSSTNIFSQPTDVAVDSKGYVYVTDEANKAVYKHSPWATQLFWQTQPGETMAGSAFEPQPAIVLVGGTSNAVPISADSSSTVSLSLNNANGAMFIGQFTHQFNNGSVMFSDLGIDLAGTYA